MNQLRKKLEEEYHGLRKQRVDIEEVRLLTATEESLFRKAITATGRLLDNYLVNMHYDEDRYNVLNQEYNILKPVVDAYNKHGIEAAGQILEAMEGVDKGILSVLWRFDDLERTLTRDWRKDDYYKDEYDI